MNSLCSPSSSFPRGENWFQLKSRTFHGVGGGKRGFLLESHARQKWIWSLSSSLSIVVPRSSALVRRR